MKAAENASKNVRTRQEGSKAHSSVSMDFPTVIMVPSLSDGLTTSQGMDGDIN